MTAPFVVIGGDAAGLSAASKAKREDPERAVVVYEQSDWISYAHCGMPYFVKGEVESLGDMLSLTPTEVEERGIELHRNHEVTSIDPDRKMVEVEGPDGTIEQAYGDLLVATGARADRTSRRVGAGRRLHDASHALGRGTPCAASVSRYRA